MLIELNIGEIQMDGFVGIHESVLQPAIHEAIQLLLVQSDFSKMQLNKNLFNLDEISFQIDGDGSVKKIATRIAEEIVQYLRDAFN